MEEDDCLYWSFAFILRILSIQDDIHLANAE